MDNTLSDFAAIQPRYTRCKICLLPDDVREELESSRATNSRVTFKVMQNWLNEQKSDVLRKSTGINSVSKDQVYRHWSAGHHVR
jgi:hypothetical protein